MSEPKKIVLFGVRGSGKDTVGHEIVKQVGWGDAETEAFANPLKEMAGIAFGFTRDELYGPSEMRERMNVNFPFSGTCPTCGEGCTQVRHAVHDDGSARRAAYEFWQCPRCSTKYPQYVTPRLALQTLGTEWGRRLYKDIWVDACFRRMTDTLLGQAERRARKTKLFIVTDGRFLNEKTRSSALGAKTVLLQRRIEDSIKATHPSEHELSTIPVSEFDYVLRNRGALEELPGLVTTMLKDLGIVL